MLYLNPPQAVIDGVACYPDHLDKLQWYYLPLVPRVSYRAGVPQMVLRAFNSERGGGGVLDLDVNLGLDEPQAKKLQARLQDLMKLEGPPRLAPMPPSAGSVRLILLGQGPGKDGAPGTGAVRSVAYPAAPSLYGDNQATFSVYLDEVGAQLVEASLTGEPGEMTAVGVIYDLSFDALRPAYNISARASWKKVHDSFLERFQEEGIFFGADISKSIDKMVDDQVIQLDVDNLLTGEDQTSAVQAMLAQVKGMIFDTFFTVVPQPQPPPNQPDFWDRYMEMMKRSAQMTLTMGLSEVAHFTWTRKEIQEVLQKELHIDLRERSVVKLELHPQGHLTDLVASIPNPPPLVQRLTLDDDLYKKRNLEVDSNLDFKTDSISSIVVDLDYGGSKKSLLLRPEDGGVPKEQSASWLSLLDGMRMRREVKASYTVNFNPRENTAWPARLVSEPTTLTGDFWTVNPRELYTVNTVQFVMPQDFPWERYPLVNVQARYADPAHGIQVERTFLLQQGTKLPDESVGVAWQFLQRDPRVGGFDYKLSFRLANGSTREYPWRTTGVPYVLIEDPLPNKKSIRVRPPSPWPDTLDSIELQLTYEDRANKVSIHRDVLFDADNTSVATLELRLADPGRQTYDYEVTFNPLEGKSITLPRSSTDKNLLRLAEDMTAHRVVQLGLEPGALGDYRLDHVELEVKPAEAPDDAPADRFRFQSADDTGRFEYDFVRNGAFRYRAIYFYADETRYTAKWGESNANTLRLPLMANPN